MKSWPEFHDIVFFSTWQLCKVIAGQRYTKSLSTKQRQLQIAECKQSPQERRRICENVSWVAFNTCLQPLGILRSTLKTISICFVTMKLQAMAISKYNSDPLIAEFGLQFRNQLAAVKGRILSPPQVIQTCPCNISKVCIYFSSTPLQWQLCLPDIKFWLWLDSYGQIQIDFVQVLWVLAGWVQHFGKRSVMCYCRGFTWCLNPSACALPLTADTYSGKYWSLCWIWDALSTSLELTFLCLLGQLEFGGGRTEEPREGRWNFNNKVHLEHTQCRVNNWEPLCMGPTNVLKELLN